MNKIRLSSKLVLFYKLTGATTALIFIALGLGFIVVDSDEDGIIFSIFFLVSATLMIIRTIKLKSVWFDNNYIYFKGLFKEDSVSLNYIKIIERNFILIGWTIYYEKDYSKLKWVLFNQPYFSNFNWALYMTEDKKN